MASEINASSAKYLQELKEYLNHGVSLKLQSKVDVDEYGKVSIEFSHPDLIGYFNITANSPRLALAQVKEVCEASSDFGLKEFMDETKDIASMLRSLSSKKDKE